MGIAEMIGRFLLLLLSMGGYIVLLDKRFRVEKEFAPIIAMGGIGCLVFLSGILNVMDIVFWTVFIFGLAMAVFYFLKIKCSLYKCGRYFSFGMLVMLFLAGYLYFFLSDVKYYHYDNFSHWGLVIKTIFKNSGFPNFQDSIIHYQSYPLGSAGFIWYICRIVGYTEGHALFAQALLYVGCAGCLFVFPKSMKDRSSKYVCYTLVLMANLVLVSYGHRMGNGLFELLVDALLASIALAAIVIVIFYNRSAVKAALCVSPLLVFEVCIKNSGVMWVFSITLAIVVFNFRSLKIRDLVRVLCPAAVLPLIFRLLWNKHVELVFVKGNNSTHSMSVENYSNIFAGKTQEDIHSISKLFLEATFSWENRIWVIAIAFGALIAILFFFQRKLLKETQGFAVFVYAMAVYTIYQIGNYAMYLFSMPLNEALYLAGYGRYVMTIEAFMWGLLMSYMLLLLNKVAAGNMANILNSLLICAFLGLLSYEAGDALTLIRFELPVNVREVSRIHLDNIVEQNDLQEEKKSLIYIGGPPDRDAGYRYWMSRYVLYSPNIKTVTSKDVYELNKLNSYDYVIILEPDEAYEGWLADAGLPIDFHECFVREKYQYVKFAEYLPKLKNEQYIVFLSVKDDCATAFNNEMKEAMAALGLKCDLTGKYRNSYAAVIDGGNVVFEKLSDEKIIYEENRGGLGIRLTSAGFKTGNRSEIVIDGTDYSRNTRGINIVIYDKNSREVCERITFDTWLMDGLFME